MSKPKNQPTVHTQVKNLLADGWTPRAIAHELDLSTQRVYQVMDLLKARAEKREAASG